MTLEQVGLRSLRDGLHRQRETVGKYGASVMTIVDFLQPAREVGEIGWLNHYCLIRLLGEGGMGCVFEAEDTRLRRHVALKFMRPVDADNAESRERFLREARSLAALSHPHIIAVYDLGLACAVDGQHDLPYLAMQFLQGETLEEAVLRRGPMPQDEVIRIGRETAEGLAAAHAAGLIHRDIKPANLWLESPHETVKLLDFGLAREIGGDRALSVAGQPVGTPLFMSPEQARGDPIDPRADLFSLGCVLYTVLTAELPFDGSSIMAVLTRLATYSPPPLTVSLPGIDPGLSALVQDLLAKDPDDRPQSAEVVIERLRALEPCGRPTMPSRVVSPTVPIPGLATPPVRPSRRGVLLAAGAGAVAGMAGLGGLAWWWNRPASRTGTTPSGEPIRVGVLHSQTGTMSASEVPVLEMTQLAIEEINAAGGLLGRPVEAVVSDGASNEAVFAREAEQLIAKEGIVALFGCWTSASRKAVKEVVEARKHLLFYPVQYEGLEQSPRIVYTGAAPNQQLLPAADWCVRQRQKRTVLLVGSDYIFPRAANAILRHRLTELKAEVLAELYVPLGSTEVHDITEAIRKHQPEVILNTINGDSNVAFFRALHQANATPRDTLTVSFSVDEQSLRSLDPRTVAGTYLAWNYFAALPGAVNTAFKERYQRRWGRHKVVTDPMEAAWLGVRFWAEAVESCGRPDDLDAVRRCLSGNPIDAPEGPGLQLDANTQHAWKYFRLGRITAGGEIQIAHEDDTPTAPVPFPKYRTPAEWQAWQQDLYRRWGGRWSAPSDG
jgi:urea transport system substrate-binding protein